jgi:hypothetical protein
MRQSRIIKGKVPLKIPTDPESPGQACRSVIYPRFAWRWKAAEL